MSLINLLNEQKKEQEISNVKNTGRTIISTAAIAGTAYLLSENINLKAGVKKSYGVLKNSSAAQNELGAAGNVIRQDAEKLKEIVNQSRLATLTKFKDEILSDANLERMFSETSSPEEARAFISALFDTASEDMIDDSGTLRATLERLYKAAGTPSIEENDKQTAINFYKSNIRTSQNRLGEFQKRHSLMMRTRGQFDTTLTEFTTEGTNTAEWKSMSVSELADSDLKKFNQLKSMSSGKNIQLVSINEFEGEAGKSVYARVEHSNGRFQNVALRLARDKKSGTAIIRGTENLSTRYTVTGGVIDVTRLFPGLNLNNLSIAGSTNVTDAMKSATMNFEDHLFEMIKENKRVYQNFSTRNINQYNDYIRSMSIDTPRTMIAGLNSTRKGGEKLIDDDLMSTLIDSRRFQSSIHKIVGLEKLSPKDREQVTKRILQYESSLFGGTSGAQTLTSRFTDPFDLNQERVIGHIERLRTDDGTRTPTAFNVMRRYGYLDRSLIPQTARAAQVYGRPELAVGFADVARNSMFGKGSGIKISGMHDELIGVTRDDAAKNVRGINFGAIMVFEKLEEARHGNKVIKSPAAQLGLGEGMSYMGGTVQVKRDFSRTINREGINQSKLMTEILAAARSERRFVTIGSRKTGDDYDIDEFFKIFGDSEGRAVLGKQDDRIVHIKRHKGMRRFKLGLSEKSRETARDRYHITGQLLQDVSHSKLFSSLAKDTTITVTQDSMMQKLNQLGLEDIGTAYFDSRQFGGKIANTLLTTTAQVGKSATYLRTQIHGGMRMLGLNEKDMSDALDASMRELNDVKVLLAEINNNQLGEFKSSLTSLDQVTAKQRSASTLGKFFQTIAQRAGSEGISADHFGMVMSFARHQARDKKFGYDLRYFEKKIAAGLKSAGVKNINDYLEKIKETAERGIVIGAAFGTVGTPHTDLGRNVAKAEPRFANYLYSSLRSFFNMDPKEASGYISSMISRMEGFESRAGGLIGMKITQESLGKLDAKSIQEQISGLEDVGRLSKDEITELLELGQGREREVVQKLSEKRGGNILNLEDIGLSKNALDEFYKFTGGKKEIFLPGEDTFKGFIGHEIRSAEETIKIEAEYSRNITDLLSSISSLRDAGSDADQIDASLKGFQTVRSSLSKVAGTAIRNSLSGRVLGSGSYMGGGFTLGKDGVGATIFSPDKKIQKQIVEGLSEVVNKEMGYVSFMDQQAFLDGMTTFESAVNKHLASQGSVSTRKETSRIMLETLEAFFTGMHRGRGKKEGVSATIQRNPVIGFSHIFGGMGIYQFDFTEELKPLSLLRAVPGEEFTDDYKAHLRKLRSHLNAPALNKLLGEDLNTPEARDAVYRRSQAIYDRKQEIHAERTRIAETDSHKRYMREKGNLIAESREINERMASNELLAKRKQVFDVDSSETPRHLMPLHSEISAVHERRKNSLEELKKVIEENKNKRNILRRQIASSQEGSVERTSLTTEMEALKKESENLLGEKRSIEKQILESEKNKQKFGRAVLGGGDVSINNVERSLEAAYHQVLDGKMNPRALGGREQANAFISKFDSFFGMISEMSRDQRRVEVRKRVNEIRSGGRGITNLNLASREDLLKIRGVDETYADAIIKARKEGLILNQADFEERVLTQSVNIQPTRTEREFVGPSGKKIKYTTFKPHHSIDMTLEQLGKAPRLDNVSFVPKTSVIGAYEVMTGARDVEDLRDDEEFYRNREKQRRIKDRLAKLEKSSAAADQQLRNTLYKESRKLKEEEISLRKRKDIIKEASARVRETEPDLSLGDLDKIGSEGTDPRLQGFESFTGEKVQPSVAVNKDLRILDEALNTEVRTGAHLAALREMKEEGRLSSEASGAYERIYGRMLSAHIEHGDFGGGMIRMPQIDMSMNIEDTVTGKVTKYSGRMDFARFGIGDFDADTYQAFFDVDKTLRSKIISKEVDASKMYAYGAQFLTSMSLLGQGIDELGKRMNASQMTTAQSIVDEYQKEQIVKGIGGLDVQVKAGMLGLAQAAADDTSGDFANQFRRMQAGAALVSVAQEVLGIKGKKLPIAANISKEYLGALKESYKTGSGDALKNFFQQKIFKGTLLENANANLKIDVDSIEFHNLGDGEATRRFKEALSGVGFTVQEIFDSFDIMARNVKKYGLNNFTSNASLGRVLEGSSRFNSQQLFQLLNRGMSMEGGLIAGEMNEIEGIFGRIETARNSLVSSVSKGKGLAGIVAGSLVASYAIGANTSIDSLEPGAKFSDSSSKEALKAGQRLSNRGIQNSFSREHGNVNPGRVSGLDNFYERPINNGVSTVSLNRSIRMYGEAPNLSAAQTMGKHFVSAGGQASLTVNDNRRPIGAAYINKMIRD